ncbi:hypothetical protein [Bradyrhizobium sp. SZCCHNRI2010]|uniref:hypothetical protein n=1 Tax=Bradyrhizobium sp. SZCCHNRI2010 TaxID=3057283 RepID=UPI0028E9AD26|nr:hypothetical protein [Bradyrhizobium sp. SZCCHNRI2010]
MLELQALTYETLAFLGPVWSAVLSGFAVMIFGELHITSAVSPTSNPWRNEMSTYVEEILAPALVASRVFERHYTRPSIESAQRYLKNTPVSARTRAGCVDALFRDVEQVIRDTWRFHTAFNGA